MGSGGGHGEGRRGPRAPAAATWQGEGLRAFPTCSLIQQPFKQVPGSGLGSEVMLMAGGKNYSKGTNAIIKEGCCRRRRKKRQTHEGRWT